MLEKICKHLYVTVNIHLLLYINLFENYWNIIIILLMENFINGHSKSDWTKIFVWFFHTKINIGKSSKIMLMNVIPEFLTTQI